MSAADVVSESPPARDPFGMAFGLWTGFPPEMLLSGRQRKGANFAILAPVMIRFLKQDPIGVYFLSDGGFTYESIEAQS